jgi:nicotinate-nucleotide adenylyltransferase
MNKLRIGIGGSAANPPHLGHKELVRSLLESGRLDEMIWIPSGIRPDKDGFVSAEHRAAMTMLTFPKEWFDKNEPRFTVCFDDVYGGNTPTIEVIENYKKKYPNAEIVWYTSVDVVMPQDKFGGKSEMEAKWNRGPELYRSHKFVVVPRPGYADLKMLNLPANFEVLDLPQLDISSTDIRKKVSKGELIDMLVTPEVAEYIKKNNLYK